MTKRHHADETHEEVAAPAADPVATDGVAQDASPVAAPVAVAPTHKRWRLLARAQMDGAVREPGYIFSLPLHVRPPHRAHMSDERGAHLTADAATPGARDVPLAVEINEDHERATAEMAERHARELDGAKTSAERDALSTKHGQEFAELRQQGIAWETEQRQASESEHMVRRHDAETKGLEDARSRPVAIVPVETNPDDLKLRQAYEAATLKDKHDRERVAQEAGRRPEAEPPVAEQAPAVDQGEVSPV